jgi:thiamine-phosphate pyrophosphorylase
MNRPRLDLTLYLVADGEACRDRGVVDTVRAAVAGGATAVQLRDHRATTRQLYEASLELRGVLEGSGVCFFVDDRLDVALATGADGVHLGQSDLPAEAARRIAGPEFVIGWSVTNFVEAAAAAAFPPGTIDYLGVGPVFPTGTKVDAAPPIGVEALRATCAASALPCVAIGGITADRVSELADTGAAGIAVVAAICSAEDPRAAAAELRRWRG